MNKKNSSDGDRIDLGGKIPQFDAFSYFAYKELLNNNLAWIRIADPNAAKLDDIQYATHSEIRAYQVKWSNKDDPTPFSFSNFTDLLPDLYESWKQLKIFHTRERKHVTVHLLTNRPLSAHDSITSGGRKLGSFDDFYREVYILLKLNQKIAYKWMRTLVELRQQLRAEKKGFKEFSSIFEIHYNFEIPARTKNIQGYKLKEDVLKLSRFIIDEVAAKKQTIQYNAENILSSLGWQDRVKTTFQHELVIDKTRYQPIEATINELTKKINTLSGGYLFLIGGPGTGKSTLLTEWSRNRMENIFKYYAFDFVNPSSQYNHSERGEVTSLLFDLIIQIKNVGLYNPDVLPFKQDINHLLEVFNWQMQQLGEEYKTSGRKTIIIIDGLDHVPREYMAANKTFLSYLPKPDSIPQGVIIILGSQTYELDGLDLEVKLEAQKNLDKVLEIARLDKKAVFKYIDSFGLNIVVSDFQKEEIFTKSEGHALYLSYMLSKISEEGTIDKTITDFLPLDGTIENYYAKIWETILPHDKVVRFLALLARIRGNINPAFILEWPFDDVHVQFNKNATHLIDKSKGRWSFFHNSYRQFIISNTRMNLLTHQDDEDRHIKYHRELVRYYDASKAEPRWHKLFHLYVIGEYEQRSGNTSDGAFEEFIHNTTPENFRAQFFNMRPPEQIKNDIKLGTQVAILKQDIYLLVRYLFCATELHRRLFHLDPIAFVEELLWLGKQEIAKNHIREGRTLHCSKEFALQASRFFYRDNDKPEAKFLFSLSEPDEIRESSIEIQGDHNFDRIRNHIRQWIQTAALLCTSEEIIVRLNNITLNVSKDRLHEITKEELRFHWLYSLGQAYILSALWQDFDKILAEFDISVKEQKKYIRNLLREAIDFCITIKDDVHARHWLSILLKNHTAEEIKPINRVFIADLIYKVTEDTPLVKQWLKDVPQPELQAPDGLPRQESLQAFVPRIKLNKLLHLVGEGIPISRAVPASPEAKEALMVNFERNLCLIAEIHAEGIKRSYNGVDIITRIQPIVRFYYQDFPFQYSYSYRFKGLREEYFDFLIFSIASLGKVHLDKVATFFFNEFDSRKQYWGREARRNIILSLFDNNYDNVAHLKEELEKLEQDLPMYSDLSERIRESSEQAKAWMRFEQKEQAEKWITQALSESLGVGYRKDFQMNRWIEWLEKINQVEPEKANQRIEWFLKHLAHIRELTEGPAYRSASEMMLRITLRHDFTKGIRQFKWQLNEGVIGFEEAIGVILQEGIHLAKNDGELLIIARAFTDLLLPIAEDSWCELLDQLLRKSKELAETKFIEENIQSIVNAIQTKTLEEKRKSYIDTIHDFYAESGLDIEAYKLSIAPRSVKPKPYNSSNTIMLRTGHITMSEEQVLNRVKSYEDFRALFEDEDKANSFFDWTKTIHTIGPSFSIEQIKELNSIYTPGRRESIFYARLSEYALALGDKTLATDLAEKALRHSQSAGWLKFYDGGTRAAAFEAFKKISSKEGTTKAFKVFAEDLSNSSQIGEFAEHLDEILPLISEDVDTAKVWPEIQSYLDALMNTADPMENPPILDGEDYTLEQNLYELLDYLCGSPISLVSNAAKRTIAAHVALGNSIFVELLKKKSNQDELAQEQTLGVLIYVSIMNPATLITFESELEILERSPNYFIRSNAVMLLRTYNTGYQPRSTTKKALSPIYSIHFTRMRGKTKGSSLIISPSVDDPIALIEPYDFWTNILSDLSDIPRENLYYRHAEIMKQLNDAVTIDTLEVMEKVVRQNLENIGLKYSLQNCVKFFQKGP